MISKIRADVRQARPLVHCITNPISINQCANTILAAGARPMMAEHPEEAAAVTSKAGALMLNLGNITDVRKESMRISSKTAVSAGVPYLLDVCGAAALPTRREFALSLISAAKPAVVKGNCSEIMALFDSGYSSSGVDADSSLAFENVLKAAKELARQFDTTVLASGKTDIITDGIRTALIRNGTPQLGTITGTGCMQGALCAAYLSAAGGYDAAKAACIVFGISGCLAETDKGPGSFGVMLLDALSTVTDEKITQLTDMEESYEKA